MRYESLFEAFFDGLDCHQLKNGDHAGSRTSPCEDGKRNFTCPSMDTASSTPRPLNLVA